MDTDSMVVCKTKTIIPTRLESWPCWTLCIVLAGSDTCYWLDCYSTPLLCRCWSICQRTPGAYAQITRENEEALVFFNRHYCAQRKENFCNEASKKLKGFSVMEKIFSEHSLAESFWFFVLTKNRSRYRFGDCRFRRDLPPIPTVRRSRIRESRVKKPFFLSVARYFSGSSLVNALEIPQITA